MIETSGLIDGLQRASSYDNLLIDDLRELFEEGVDDDNSRWVHAVLNELCANLEAEFARDLDGGYLTEFLERYPSQTHLAARLQAEHSQLCRELKDLRDSLESRAQSKRVNTDVRKSFHNWVRRLTSLKIRETALLQQAMNSDEGECE